MERRRRRKKKEKKRKTRRRGGGAVGGERKKWADGGSRTRVCVLFAVDAEKSGDWLRLGELKALEDCLVARQHGATLDDPDLNTLLCERIERICDRLLHQPVLLLADHHPCGGVGRRAGRAGVDNVNERTSFF